MDGYVRALQRVSQVKSRDDIHIELIIAVLFIAAKCFIPSTMTFNVYSHYFFYQNYAGAHNSWYNQLLNHGCFQELDFQRIEFNAIQRLPCLNKPDTGHLDDIIFYPEIQIVFQDKKYACARV